MANGNMLTWAKRARSVDGVMSTYIKNTVDKYSDIKEMGLETVMWKYYDPKGLLFSKDDLEKFILENGPCLFINDPIVSGVGKKDAIFNVMDLDPVNYWVERNLTDIKLYNYLITTQITNPGNGFVGSVLSDGKGRMWCESLHSPGVCNHRELSQMSKKFDLNGYVNQLFVESDGINDIWSVTGKYVTRSDILELQALYSDHIGYFEFVKGVQANKKGIYTIGYESRGSFVLHDLLHKAGCMDTASRINGALLREGMR